MKTAAASRPRASLLGGVLYLYALSKRTVLYGSMLKHSNAHFRLEASSRAVSLPVATGVDTHALRFGITHRC